jgi:predicted O-linked N-acetylglucosamine transferase (SPINDLY family)
MTSLPPDWQKLAYGYESERDWDAARALYEAAQLTDPAHRHLSLLIQELRCAINVCHWDRYAHLQTAVVESVRQHGGMVSGETTLASPALTAHDHALSQERRTDAIWRQHADARADVLRLRMARPPGRNAHKPLRIGFLGGDFHGQATTYLMIGLVETHDRARLQYIAYNYGPMSGAGPLVARVRSAFDVFHDVATLSNSEIAKRITADDIDVLLFLRGPADTRAAVLAMRPAPVQLAYLYYPGGFGFPLVDGLIADSIVVPPALRHNYSEPILYLPRCYQPNDAKRPLPQPLSRHEAGLPEHAVVLANFAQSYKITPATFDVWCTLLRDHPHCLLWLLDTHPTAVRNLRKEASLRGVDPARLFFAPLADTPLHLSRLACADLVLDTWPYGGHTGTSDALWAGVPVVARSGETFASRVAVSLLHSVGLDELAAHDDARYCRIASALITDTTRRAALHDHLTRGRATFGLFDPVGYARDFDALLTRIVQHGVQAATA